MANMTSYTFYCSSFYCPFYSSTYRHSTAHSTTHSTAHSTAPSIAILLPFYSSFYCHSTVHSTAILLLPRNASRFLCNLSVQSFSVKENPELFETAGHTWQSVKSIPFSSFSQSVVTLVTNSSSFCFLAPAVCER